LEAIHYISDFTFFSGRNTGGKYSSVIDALRSHFNYIGRNQEGVFRFNFDVKGFIEKAKEEIKKRWDSRVALKFVIALPLSVSKDNVEEWGKKVQEFVAENLNVPTEYVAVCIHLHQSKSGVYNPHAHIVVYPRNREGKKLRLKRKDLSDFHRRWQEFLRKEGYKIHKLPEDERIPHIGLRLNYDKEAQELYKTYREIQESKKRLRGLEKEINHRKREERERKREKSKEFQISYGVVLLSFLKDILGGNMEFRKKQKEELERHFRELGYADDDKVVIFMTNHKDGAEKEVYHRIFTISDLKSERVLRFLSYKNANGFSIYMSINTLKPEAKSRKKEDFREKQRRIYIDLDSKKLSSSALIHKVFELMRLYGLPNPTRILRTSRGNYQFFWYLDKEVEYSTLEEIMRKINYELDVDKTQDVARVFRLPYFYNRKPNKGDLVKPVESLYVLNSKKEKIGEIRATGEPASADTFLKLLEGIKLPAPKSENEENIREQVRKKLDKIEPKSEPRWKKEVAEKMKEIPKPSAKIDNFEKYKSYYLSLFAEENKEIWKLAQIALKRNMDKSPSEVEMALLGLLYTKYEGNPPQDLLDKVLQRIYHLAILRGKYDPSGYVQRTLEKVRPKKQSPSNTLKNVFEKKTQEKRNFKPTRLRM